MRSLPTNGSVGPWSPSSGKEPGPALRSLHQRILTSDESLQPVRPTRPGATDQQPPTRNHLPRTVSDFTGREADLAWLLEAAKQADPYSSLVLAVDGMPGVGKTCLVVRAAHQLKDRSPDGQLFIDLRGHSDNPPIETTSALAALLGQLGVPGARVSTDPDERLAQWRAELATRRVLVVLDNVATGAQVAPLLPTGTGSLALLTSRRRLVDLEGARPRSVETLEPGDAVALRVTPTR